MNATRSTALPWVADRGDGTYRNPVLNADWSDPDAIRVGDYFYLTASSFNRVPGLPVLRSVDLVNWTIIGHALAELEPVEHYKQPRHGCGVWAPALRYHDGRFWIFYPDPDFGIFQVTATDPAGPWSTPTPVKLGKGLIDPCPLWDRDGQAYLVHGWAKSRSGVKNRLTLHRMAPDGIGVLDEGVIVIDGDALPGYTTLEGPKFYRDDNWYWIFAPAGGVATGWQSVFRARDVWGPYEDRVVLHQGETPVNGPHQGAWVRTSQGQDWFLHFQDRAAYGRVVHLQPMTWRSDGWPVIGLDDGAGKGTPVEAHRKPTTNSAVHIQAPSASDDFPQHVPGPQWTWQANVTDRWCVPGETGIRLVCQPNQDLRQLPSVLGQRLPAESFVATTRLTLDDAEPGKRAGLVVLGKSYAWVGLDNGDRGPEAVLRLAEADGVERTVDSAPLERATVMVRVTVSEGAVCSFAMGDGQDWRHLGDAVATQGGWIGATLGLFATTNGPAGHAEIPGFWVGPR